MLRRVLAYAAAAALQLRAVLSLGADGSFNKNVVPQTPRAWRSVMRKTVRRSNSKDHFPHKSGLGPQECARRVRQMRRGQLTMSNGLVIPGWAYLGHGRTFKVRDPGKSIFA